MDAYLKKGADWYPFCLVGAPEGGFGWWVVGQGGPAQKPYVPSIRKITASCARICISGV